MMTTKCISGALETVLVPSPVDYAVILPPNFENILKPLPLLLNLHGGGGSRDDLVALEHLYQELWAEGLLPPMVVASFTAGYSGYLNFIDGSECWEDFISEFLEYIRGAFHTRIDREGTLLFGTSMGGRGALRLAFKMPDEFGLVAVLEPGIDPVFDVNDLKPRNRMAAHLMPPEEQAKRWGWPVDPDYYGANNPVSLAQNNAQIIRSTKLKIFFEVGDRDCYNLHDGAEFLHRVLWGNRIEHEYRLLHGVDHVGSSLFWRYKEAHRWIGRMLGSISSDSPKPTPGQKAFLLWKLSGEKGEIPVESVPITPFEDLYITLIRELFEEPIRSHMNSPLEGIYRYKISRW